MRNLNLDKVLSNESVKLIHRFAEYTLDNILERMDRLEFHGEGHLRDSIRAVVHTNAGGNQMLVQFFYLYYGECVEQAVGAYYGVDQDLLATQRGLKSPNVGAPPLSSRHDGPLEGIIRGVERYHKAQNGKVYDRSKYHRPRPFLRSSIRRQVQRTSIKLLEKCSQLINAQLLVSIHELLESLVSTAVQSATVGGTHIDVKSVTTPS